MATEWLESDCAGVARLAAMIDAQGRGEAGATLLAEIRQLEDRFGLNPTARRRLGWVVQEPASVEPLGAVICARAYVPSTEVGRNER